MLACKNFSLRTKFSFGCPMLHKEMSTRGWGETLWVNAASRRGWKRRLLLICPTTFLCGAAGDDLAFLFRGLSSISGRSAANQAARGRRGTNNIPGRSRAALEKRGVPGGFGSFARVQIVSLAFFPPCCVCIFFIFLFFSGKRSLFAISQGLFGASRGCGCVGRRWE